MGVRTRIVVHAADPARADEAARAAFARIAELEAILSDWRVDSEVARVAAHAGGGPLPASDDLRWIARRSLVMSAATDGAFDVTVGPLTRAWRAAREAGRPPPEREIAAARDLVGFAGLRVDEPAGTIELSREGMSLDFGAIAKGWAAREALDVLREHGLASALVALAGDVAVGDPPPGRDGWRIALDRELFDDRRARSLVLANVCVSTSGDAEQALELGARRASHVIDPRRGLGVESGVLATVIARDGAACDALASAICVLGVDRARELAPRFGDVAILAREPSLATPWIHDPARLARID